MSPTATLMYGFGIPTGKLPARMDEILEEHGMYDRQTLAWVLLEMYNHDVEDPEGDHVTALVEKTGLWVEEYGVEHYFVVLKSLRHGVYDHGVQKIDLGIPSYEDITYLNQVAADLGIGPRMSLGVGWYLMANSN